MLKTHERLLRSESGNDSSMSGNAIVTIVLSTKAMNTPSAAIRSTVRAATGFRNLGSAASDGMERRSRRADDGDGEQADERDDRGDVERDQARERGEARHQQGTDEDGADHGLVVRIRVVRDQQHRHE